MIIGALILVLITGLAGAFWYVTQGSKDTKNPAASASPQTKGAFAKYQANVPDWLLENNRGDANVTLGYLKSAKKTSSRGGLVPSAAAADADFASVMMYKANSQSDGPQIFSYNSADGSTTQLTKQAGGASAPVFASVTQNLAYKMSPNTFDNGGITVKNLTTAAETVVVASRANVSNVPIAWSPDGTMLAYGSTNNDTTLPDWNMLKLNIYTSGKPVVEVPAPAGFNSLSSYFDVVWLNNSQLQVRFIKKIALGNTEKSQTFTVEVKDQTAIASDTVLEGELSEFQTIGETLYFLGQKPAALKAVKLAPQAVVQVVPGTEGAKTFALRLNEQGELSGLLYTTGEAGTLGAVKLFSADADGSNPAEVMTFSGYGGGVIGWGQSYDELVYILVLSGKREVHVYNLKTKTDKVILTNLPLVI